MPHRLHSALFTRNSIILVLLAAVLCAACDDSLLRPGAHLQVIEGDVLIGSAADLQALAGVHEISGSLTIGDLDEEPLLIGDLEALKQLRFIGDNLSLLQVRGLEDLDDLSELRELGGTLTLTACADLKSLGGLNGLTGLSALNCEDLPLMELPDLPHLSELTNLRLVRCGALHDLATLSGLAVTGSLELTDNPLLTAVHGLDGVSCLQGVLRIRSNGLFTSLQGLGNLSSVGSREDPAAVAIEIIDNPLLGDCSAEAFVAGLEVIGDVLISGNNIYPQPKIK